MNLADYFEKNRHTPTYEFMARVTGMHGKIRWVGSVGNDTVISDQVGPMLHIHLDLPLKIDGKYTDHLFTKHTGVKRLINFNDESTKKVSKQ